MTKTLDILQEIEKLDEYKKSYMNLYTISKEADNKDIIASINRTIKFLKTNLNKLYQEKINEVHN